MGVNLLARRVSQPRPIDWCAAKRVVRYLKGTANFELKFPAKGDIVLSAFADVNYAASSDRKSMSGTVFLLGDAVIGWSSKKQKAVALSTAEAE